MNYMEIQQLDQEDLERLIEEKRDELRTIRFEIASKRLGNHRQYRKGSAQLARFLTALQEKKRNAQVNQ